MQVIQYRRDLHRIPELGRELPKTQAYLKSVLAPLKCTLSSPIPGSLCAFFDFGKNHAIAFRGDCDALPVTERTGAPYASTHPGRMHACGHDAHMAMVLDLAVWLDKQTALPNNVLLVFQPAEETVGGARDLCRSGIFEQYNTACVFGMHLWPEVPSGVIASRAEELMIHSCEVNVDIIGKPIHIVRSQYGIDALAAAVEFYRRSAVLETTVPDDLGHLLKFGKLESGTARNVVSGHAHLLGSMRAFRDEVFQALLDGMAEIGRQLEAEFGCSVTVETSEGYPTVYNPPDLFQQVRDCGVEFQVLDEPVMIAEDFSWYQRHLPAMFFFLGTGPSPALHAEDFHFDESILQTGADFWKALAAKYKGGNHS